MTTRTTTYMTLVLMVLVAAFSRLMPHPWNFTAIGAMALFGGSYFPSRRLSLVVPLLALLISDLVLGFHSTMVFTYMPFALMVMLGWTLREDKSPLRIGTASLVTSAVFFLVSNFGVWIMDGMYALTWPGLVSCYVAAIPFFGNQILGDLFFSGVMFGAAAVLKKTAPDFFAVKAV